MRNLWQYFLSLSKIYIAEISKKDFQQEKQNVGSVGSFIWMSEILLEKLA